MADKKLKHSKNQTSCRMSHLSEDEKELAETLYKVGIDFSACSPSFFLETLLKPNKELGEKWLRQAADKGCTAAKDLLYYT